MNVMNRGVGQQKIAKRPVVRSIAEASGYDGDQLAPRFHEH